MVTLTDIFGISVCAAEDYARLPHDKLLLGWHINLFSDPHYSLEVLLSCWEAPPLINILDSGLALIFPV